MRGGARQGGGRGGASKPVRAEWSAAGRDRAGQARRVAARRERCVAWRARRGGVSGDKQSGAGLGDARWGRAWPGGRRLGGVGQGLAGRIERGGALRA